MVCVGSGRSAVVPPRGRAVVYDEDELLAWIQAQKQAETDRRQGAA